jgi:TolB-like protein/AraC-like DNA-binding protein/Tfp pilus assembly protein PilF
MPELLSQDQKFVQKLTDIVLAHLADENFGVIDLVRESGFSRTTIHRKIRSVKNQDISQFTKEIRLEKAREMLQNNEGTVAEIAYRVGFSSATYFNKCFREYFGYPPGEIKKRESASSDSGNLKNVFANNRNQNEKELRNETGHSKKSFLLKRRFLVALSVASVILITFILFILLPGKTSSGSGIKKSGKSIVVLPFRFLSEGSENQYLADGIMEDILNYLARESSLSVRSRTTSEHFRDINMTSPQIAKELDVRYFLEGSILNLEDKIRVFIQLIDARNDEHLISEKFECEVSEIMELSENIAKIISAKLEAIISKEESGIVQKKPTNNPEAYDLYLKARFLFHEANDEQRVDINREGLLLSAQLYEKATLLDSTFAEAYAGLANAWLTVSAWGWYQPYFDGINKAKQYSRKALELDPDCAEAHLVKGGYLIWPERQWEEGRKEILRSIELNPNIGYAHQAYAQLLMITGPIEEARLHMDRIMEIEPYFWVMHNLNAWIYYFEGRHKEAVEACHRAMELKDDWIFTKWLLFINYAKLGDGENAVNAMIDIAASHKAGKNFENDIKEFYKKRGISGLFEWLTEVNIKSPIPVVGLSGDNFFVSWWYAILGNREKSLQFLEKNMESQSRNYTFFNLICTNPDFDILRNDPKFIRIVDEIGLTPYNIRKAK